MDIFNHIFTVYNFKIHGGIYDPDHLCLFFNVNKPLSDALRGPKSVILTGFAYLQKCWREMRNVGRYPLDRCTVLKDIV